MTRSPSWLCNTGLCPPWFGPFLNNPARRWLHNAPRIFQRFVGPGSVVVELGCGTGPFTLALAEMVGPQGHVFAADVQARMLEKVRVRLAKRDLRNRVTLHLCAQDRVGLPKPVDFVVAFWMVHEVSNPKAMFRELWESLKPGGKLLLVEPMLHVGSRRFQQEVEAARESGLLLESMPAIRLSRAAAFSKPGK